MTCTKPLIAFRDPEQRKVVFNKPFPFAKGFNLPCGQCQGCRLNRTRQWAVRCMHEAQMHEENCFITLTFDHWSIVNRDSASVDVKDFQNFMKRLRKLSKKKIRFFHCGEYGDKFGRPHYHSIIFGYDFPDKVHFKNDPLGHKHYISDTLTKLWPYGYHDIGSVTFDSASYVARYALKKINGKQADDHYYHPISGEMVNPEYATMSRKPGIGYSWFQKYKSDVYPHDYCEIDGKKILPPRYYDELLKGKGEDPSPEYEKIKKKRMAEMEEPLIELRDPRWKRLDDIHAVRKYKTNRLKRNFELDIENSQ